MTVVLAEGPFQEPDWTLDTRKTSELPWYAPHKRSRLKMQRIWLLRVTSCCATLLDHLRRLFQDPVFQKALTHSQMAVHDGSRHQSSSDGKR